MRTGEQARPAFSFAYAILSSSRRRRHRNRTNRHNKALQPWMVSPSEIILRIDDRLYVILIDKRLYVKGALMIPERGTGDFRGYPTKKLCATRQTVNHPATHDSS